MDKIVLLPQTKRQLIQTANEAFQAADYEHAVTVLEELVHYNVSSFEIHMNLVISLMKVKEWTKAIDYAEDFIPLYTKDKQSQLVELIVMALFEQEDFPATLARIEEAFEEEIVPEVQQRLEMIRVLCSEQNAIRSTTLLHEMEMLVKQEEHIELFYIMKEWKRLNIQPPDVFNDFLKNSFVHPVIKTFILEELQDNNISATVEVEKFGKIIEVIPNQIENYNQQKFVIDLFDMVEEMEQQNPSIAQIMKELIYQYSYVMYPFVPRKKDVDLLQRAFVILSSAHFEDTKKEVDSQVSIHIENIRMSHHLYQSINKDTNGLLD